MTTQNAIDAVLAVLKVKIPSYWQTVKSTVLGPVKLPDQEIKPVNYSVSSVQYSVPLQIGNELMITSELVKANKYLSNATGRVVIIDQILDEEHDAIRASAFGIQVDVDMYMACQMRAAFLEREQTFI